MEFDALTVVLLLRGDDPPELTPDEASAMQDLHMAHLAQLHDDGHLLAAGPVLGPPDRALRGINLMRGDVPECLALCAADPGVTSGIFRLEGHPWLVPGGAMSFQSTFFPRNQADL